MDKKAEQKKSLRENTESYMSKYSLEKTEEPKGASTQMSLDPTRLNPKVLQREYTAMVAWLCYANDRLAEVNQDWLEANKALRLAQAQFRFSHDNKGAKWKVDDELILDPKIRKLDRRVMLLESKKIMLETVVANYTEKSKALSRELTRRMGEMDRSGRL